MGNKFDTQTPADENGCWVGVRSGGVHRDTGQEVASEFLLDDTVTGEHVHIGLDENGEVIFESRRNHNDS